MQIPVAINEDPEAGRLPVLSPRLPGRSNPRGPQLLSTDLGLEPSAIICAGGAGNPEGMQYSASHEASRQPRGAVQWAKENLVSFWGQGLSGEGTRKGLPVVRGLQGWARDGS